MAPDIYSSLAHPLAIMDDERYLIICDRWLLVTYVITPGHVSISMDV
jgi:hypothetical protein